MKHHDEYFYAGKYRESTHCNHGAKIGKLVDSRRALGLTIKNDDGEEHSLRRNK